MRRIWSLTSCLAGLSVGQAYAQSTPPAPVPGLDKLQHIIVLYLENRSFDNLYGLFPGAEGLESAKGVSLQVDRNGKVFATLPPVVNTSIKPSAVDPRFPADLPNAPFGVEQYVALDKPTGDLVHRWYQEQEQIDGGKMDKFAAVSDAKGLVMGYYDGSALPMWKIAKENVLADHFFHAAFGGSFLNHIWLVCACSPRYDEAPATLIATEDARGHMVKDGAVTPDGYAVNTIQSVYMPHSPAITDETKLLPPQTQLTIGDRLSAKGVSWDPGYADVLTGDQNVAPPAVDKWGPGTRIPTIIVSPFAKRGFVDHTRYDTTSILKLIETRFQLPPLSSRDAGANDLTNALELH